VTAAVRVLLPTHLRNLARCGAEVTVDVTEPVTQRTVIDALEVAHPTLRNTVRDPATGRRRAFVRLYVGESDLSHDDPDAPLPDEVADARVPLRIIGAMAGG
jgi:sulfur-carrier protein